MFGNQCKRNWRMASYAALRRTGLLGVCVALGGLSLPSPSPAGELQTIVFDDDLMPSGNNYGSTQGRVRLAESGDVVFWASEGYPHWTLYRYSDGTWTIYAQQGDSVGDRTIELFKYSPGIIGASPDAAAWTQLRRNECQDEGDCIDALVRWTDQGVPSVLMSEGQAAPDIPDHKIVGGGGIAPGVVGNIQGDVATDAHLTFTSLPPPSPIRTEGIFRAFSGQAFDKIFATADAAPTQGETFGNGAQKPWNFGVPDMNAFGDLAVFALTKDEPGNDYEVIVFVDDQGVLQEIAHTGDVIDGHTLGHLSYYPMINDWGSIVFWANSDHVNPKSSIYRYDPGSGITTVVRVDVTEAPSGELFEVLGDRLDIDNFGRITFHGRDEVTGPYPGVYRFDPCGGGIVELVAPESDIPGHPGKTTEYISWLEANDQGDAVFNSFEFLEPDNALLKYKDGIVPCDCNSNGVGDPCDEDLCDGDANCDGVVNPLDSGYVSARYGCTLGVGDCACEAANVNGDGVVDPLDVGYILARYGTCQ